MQDWSPSFLALPITSRTLRPRIAIWMVTVMQRQQDLHKVVPDGFFRYQVVVLLRLLDDGRQVSASAIFHQNVQHACITVNIAVVILHNMCMVEILQNVASCGSGQALPVTVRTTQTNTSATTCLRSRSFMRSKSISFRAKIWDALKSCKSSAKRRTHDPILFPLDFSDDPKRPISDNVEWLVVVQKRRRARHHWSLQKQILRRDLLRVTRPMKVVPTDSL